MASKAKQKDRLRAPGEDICSILTEILAEVESRGCEGHWLSKSSSLVGRARIALTKHRHQKEKPPEATALEFALRELIWRVDHVRQWLQDHPDPDRPVEIEELLDTSGLQGFLQEGRSHAWRPGSTESRRRLQ